MIVYFARTAESIELPFGVVSRVGPRYHAFDLGSVPPTVRGNFFGGMMLRDVTYRQNAASTIYAYSISTLRSVPTLL